MPPIMPLTNTERVSRNAHNTNANQTVKLITFCIRLLARIRWKGSIRSMGCLSFARNPDASDWYLPVQLQPSFPREWILLRSEEHTSELQSLMRISYAVFCLKKKKERRLQMATPLNTD